MGPSVIFTAPVRWSEMPGQGTYHFVLFPRPVKVNMTVEPSLQNCPSTSLRFHVTIGLRKQRLNTRSRLHISQRILFIQFIAVSLMN